MARHSVEFKLENPEDAVLLFGSQDKNAQLIESQLAVDINYRGERVQIFADNEVAPEQARKVLQALLVLISRGLPVHSSDAMIAVKMVLEDNIENFITLYEIELTKDAVGTPIRLKNVGQKLYVDSVKQHDVVFGIGPAGTGKTFLAVVMAVQALRNGQVKRIILTRPAVEAGENLGFLPGDLQEKVDPYLRPVYDALFQILGKNATERMMERGIIEIAPLGFNSKMIVNGDISQIDLPAKAKSGLIDAKEKLSGLNSIDFVYFTAKDVVRHPVVAQIINAYEKKGE